MIAIDVTTDTLSAALAEPGAVPEWIQIVPKGRISAYDGRGPFWYDNAAELIEASFSGNARIVIDANHSTETIAKLGGDAPAHGYVVAMEERDDGIWGRVDWNPSGTALMQNRSYWGVSPVLARQAKTGGKIVRIKSVALTNDPGLRELASLNSANMENGMDFLKQVADALGLRQGGGQDEPALAQPVCGCLAARGTVMTQVLLAPLTQPDLARHLVTVEPGQTLAAIIDRMLPRATEAELANLRVTLVTDAGVQLVPRALWPLARPRPGVRVVLRVVPQGGAVMVLSALVSSAAEALAPFLADALGVASSKFLTGLVSVGLSLVGSALINALISGGNNSGSQDRAREVFSVSGWQNELRLGEPVPCAFGRHRYAPPYAAQPYTEIVGDQQFVRGLFTFGYGPLTIEDIRLGDTSIDEFSDIQYELREGRTGDDPVALYPQQVLEDQLGVELIRPVPVDAAGDPIDAPNEARPITRQTANDAAFASVILVFPSGLFAVTRKGNLQNRDVDIRIRQRPSGGTWQEVETLHITAAKRETFFRQHTWQLPTRGRWDIKVERLTDDRTGSNESDRVTWMALQSIRPEYPVNTTTPLALLSMRIRATYQLNGRLDNVNAVAGRVATVELAGVTGVVNLQFAQAATTGNIALTGAQTVDGETLTDGDRVAVLFQTDAAQNGLYIYNSAGAWTRSADMNASETVNLRAVFVADGATYAGGTFLFSAADPGTFSLGTDAIVVTQIESGGAVQTQLDGKADIADPDFSGTPTLAGDPLATVSQLDAAVSAYAYGAREVELVIEDRIPAPVALSQFTITPTVDGPVIDLETNGTDGALWMAVVPDGALEPSWSQIEAGTDGTGAPAIYATSIEVGALDTAFSFDPPVVGGELYDCYVFHKLSDGHSSRRVVASFSGLRYVATGGQDGTAGDLTIYSGGVFSDNQPDANGGNTAVNLVDANDGLTGQLGAQFNITLPARTILFSAKVKKQAGYFDGFRVSTQNLSESYFATVDLTSGALLDDSFPSGMTVADLGGGWWEMSTSLDVSTWADLTGKILLTVRNGTGAAVLRDGSNILTISDAVIL